jgi:hypothetical protein
VAAIRHAQAIEAATVKLPPADPTTEITGTRSEQRVKMNRMRQRIAQRLKEAQNTNAMLTTFNEIDMRYVINVKPVFVVRTFYFHYQLKCDVLLFVELFAAYVCIICAVEHSKGFTS